MQIPTTYFNNTDVRPQNSPLKNSAPSDKIPQNKMLAETLKDTTNIYNPVLEKGLDLTRIKPEDAYNLAAKLYEDGEIDIYQMAHIFIMGLNHQYPPDTSFDTTPQANNRPFNLLAELALDFQTFSEKPEMHYKEHTNRLGTLLDKLTEFFNHANDVKSAEMTGTLMNVQA